MNNEKKLLIKLGIKKAIAFLEKRNENEVFCKVGVWNHYEKVSKEIAIKKIGKSGYGADIREDVKTKELYVSIPANSDMW